jgi:gamma-glutamyltranspeptidase / glutathione hydrolase
MTRLPASVAAGHPATAQAGLEILDDGGTAADAAVAASLASCVAETIMTGLLGGGHGIYFDATRGRARNLDCFVTVPSGRGSEVVGLAVPFGEELVHYAVGPATCGVPGVPAGLDLLWREHGRLPWSRLCEPALQLAKDGVDLPPAHASCLAMLAPVMTMREGARIYAPGGRLLAAGDRLQQPGLVPALEAVESEGLSSVYTGTIAAALLALCAERGGRVTRADLARYAPRWSEPVGVPYAGSQFLTRGGLSGVPELLARMPGLRGLDSTDRVLVLVDPLAERAAPAGHTTNLVTVDREGNACVLTTSLGLGSGDWLPGLDLHLNSMLGEVDLVQGELVPGERMQSMMAPSLVVREGGLSLAVGSAGGTRLRTALATVVAGILEEGLEPQAAIERPRFHPAGATVNAEPGVDEPALAELERRGWTVRRWPERHHYFGGVSAIGERSSGHDPRRSGASRLL